MEVEERWEKLTNVAKGGQGNLKKEPVQLIEHDEIGVITQPYFDSRSGYQELFVFHVDFYDQWVCIGHPYFDYCHVWFVTFFQHF